MLSYLFLKEDVYKRQADGSAQEIAKKYGVQDSLLEQEPCEFKQSDSDSDVAVSYTHLYNRS